MGKPVGTGNNVVDIRTARGYRVEVPPRKPYTFQDRLRNCLQICFSAPSAQQDRSKSFEDSRQMFFSPASNFRVLNFNLRRVNKAINYLEEYLAVKPQEFLSDLFKAIEEVCFRDVKIAYAKLNNFNGVSAQFSGLEFIGQDAVYQGEVEPSVLARAKLVGGNLNDGNQELVTSGPLLGIKIKSSRGKDLGFIVLTDQQKLSNEMKGYLINFITQAADLLDINRILAKEIRNRAARSDANLKKRNSNSRIVERLIKKWILGGLDKLSKFTNNF